MTYPEYKIAAERHLETCLQLLFILEKYKVKEQTEGLLSPETKDREKILGDLYYLSGYIIECSYNCAIYHHISWNGDVDRLKTNSTSFRVSCYPDNNAVFSLRRETGRISGIKQHQLSGNMHFFQTVQPRNTPYPIPLIIDPINNRFCIDLFDNWSAEIRYTIDSSLNLNYDNVFDFFYLATEVYEGLIKNSMI